MANLNIYNKITSSNLNEFKNRIIDECKRRVYTGTHPKVTNEALSEQNTVITSNWFNTFINPLKTIDASKIDYNTTSNISIIKALTNIESQVAILEGIDVNDDTTGGCSASCTGLCYTSCATNCRNGCLTGCSSCGGACSSGCGTTCSSDGCTGSCYNVCSGPCGGNCSALCSSGCSVTCTNQCASGCGSGCTSSCTSSCAVACSKGSQ